LTWLRRSCNAAAVEPRPHPSLLLAAFCTAFALPAAGLAADLRDCRLDALGFVDPWGGDDRFFVERVGAFQVWLCFDAKGEMTQVEQPKEGADCQGPYGDLVLEGRYEGWSDELLPGMTAIWSVQPAAPCCGWEVFPSAAAPAERLARVTWYAPGAAPVLGTIPTASITQEYGEQHLVNPLVALICAHPLP
jgi:hypothetical protein